MVRKVAPYSFHHSDRLMANQTATVVVFHRLIWPEIAAANTGAGDRHQSVGRLDDPVLTES